MPWIYEQRSGRMLKPDGSLLAIGYSGHGDGVNNPDLQNIRAVGPLPRGMYTIGGESTRKGPITLYLEPHPDTVLFGRGGFLVHGDNSKRDRSASLGCIILGPVARTALRDSEDRLLNVVEKVED